jgi:hypothetical protein
MPLDGHCFEKHYSIGELAEIWGVGRETLRLIFSREPGVMKIQMGRKKKNCSYRIPSDVAERVHRRLTT